MNQKYPRCTCVYCVGEASQVMKSCVMLRQKKAERKMKEGKRGYERLYNLNEILMEEEV